MFIFVKNTFQNVANKKPTYRFAKGNKGKPKGAVNHTTKDAKEIFVMIIEGEIPDIKTALLKLKNRSPYRYLECLTKLLPYFMPRKIDLKTNLPTVRATIFLPDNGRDKNSSSKRLST